MDLPVVRDPLGYPFVPGSMIKGSLRTMLGRKDGLGSNSVANRIRCLFGPEPTDQDKHAGSLTILDSYPLLIPAPSSRHGVLYVTSHYLLSRASELAKTSGKNVLASELEGMAKLDSEDHAILVNGQSSGTVRVGAYQVRVKTGQASTQTLENTVSSLHVLYNSIKLDGRILILPPDKAVPVIESLLLRLTRVRLDRSTKTVATGGLWTEEYLPWGTLLLGAVMNNKFKANNCPSNPLSTLKSMLGGNGASDHVFTLVLGGKETVGGGLVRFKLL